MVRSGETSDGKRKRGRPSSQLSPEVEEARKERKKRTDRTFRQEIKAIFEQLVNVAPVLLQLVEFVANGENIRQFLATLVELVKGLPLLLELVQHVASGENIRQFLDAIARFKESALVDQSNIGELQQNQGQNVTWSTPEIKEVSEAMQLLRNEAVDHTWRIRELKAMMDRILNDVALVASRDHRNFVSPSAIAMAEQPETWSQFGNNDPIANGCNFDMQWLLADFGNNEPISRCPTSFDQNGENSHQNDESFDSEQVEIFFKQYDGNTKRRVEFSDFNGLVEELNKVGHNVIPSFLTPTAEKIKAACGDIAEHCTLADCAIYPTRIMLYATIKEIDELKDLKDVSMAKLKVWRDAIIDAQQFKFTVEFAKSQLTKIARAYFGSKAKDLNLDEQKMIFEGKLHRITKMIQVREKYQAEATYFNEMPLNTGLFPEKQYDNWCPM